MILGNFKLIVFISLDRDDVENCLILEKEDTASVCYFSSSVAKSLRPYDMTSL